MPFWTHSPPGMKRMSSSDLNPPYRFSGMIRLLCMVFLPAVLGCGVFYSMIAPTATQTPTASLTPTATLTLTPEPTFTPTPTQIPTVCGGPPAMFILLAGSDSRKDSYAAGLADSIRLVRVDFVEPRIQLLPFPRDLYVEIPAIEDKSGITHGKLNQAYLYGNSYYNYFDGPGEGPGLLALTLEQNFGAQVDHYMAVNIQSLVRIVDKLGGIDIDLPYVIDGRVPGSKDPNLYFVAGEQHLDGYRTMLLARLRPEGDLQRIEVQNLILQALTEKLFSLSALREFPALIESLRDSVQTDLGPVEVGKLLCLSAMLDLQKIEFINFPDNLFKSDRVRDPVLGSTSILVADFEILKKYVQNFNEGAWLQSVDDPEEGIQP